MHAQHSLAERATQGRRLGNIELLRFIAAALVVFYHLHIRFAERVGLLPELNQFMGEFGASGVDIFFVISGFVIAMNVMEPSNTPKKFISARFARIIPTYWILTLVVAALMVLWPAVFNTGFSIPRLFESLLFVTDRLSDSLPLIGVGWSLNFEIGFYLLVFAILFIRVRRDYSLLLQSVALFTLVLLGIFNPIFIEFIFGYLAYFLWRNVRVSKLMAAVFLVAGSALLASWRIVAELADTRWVYFGLPGFLLLLGAVSLPQISGDWVRRLGFSSYSIYLTQWLSIPVVGLISLQLTRIANLAPLFFVIGIFIVLFIGVIYSEFIDVRLYAWARKRLGLSLKK